MARGKRYRQAYEQIDRTREYPPAEAIHLVKQTAGAGFDETVELHIRLGVNVRHAEEQLRGTLALPRGLGKDVTIAVFAEGEQARAATESGADFVGSDDLAARVEDGWTDFDVAIATPSQMPKVGKLGRVLGPQGKMPNPKVGTVTDDVAKAVDEAKAGKVEYRTDRQAIVHLAIGKTSFDEAGLLENYAAVIEEIIRAKPAAAKGRYILSITVTSTMGPGIRVDPSRTRSTEILAGAAASGNGAAATTAESSSTPEDVGDGAPDAGRVEDQDSEVEEESGEPRGEDAAEEGGPEQPAEAGAPEESTSLESAPAFTGARLSGRIDLREQRPRGALVDDAALPTKQLDRPSGRRYGLRVPLREQQGPREAHKRLAVRGDEAGPFRQHRRLGSQRHRVLGFAPQAEQRGTGDSALDLPLGIGWSRPAHYVLDQLLGIVEPTLGEDRARQIHRDRGQEPPVPDLGKDPARRGEASLCGWMVAHHLLHVAAEQFMHSGLPAKPQLPGQIATPDDSRTRLLHVPRHRLLDR